MEFAPLPLSFQRAMNVEILSRAIKRMPKFCDNIEVIFVEGHSSDGTMDEIKRVAAAYPDWNIKVLAQPGKGKADAVFAGFRCSARRCSYDSRC